MAKTVKTEVTNPSPSVSETIVSETAQPIVEVSITEAPQETTIVDVLSAMNEKEFLLHLIEKADSGNQYQPSTFSNILSQRLKVIS